MTELQILFKELIGLTESEWIHVKMHLNKKEFKTKTAIIHAGAIADHLYFIESGLLRTYYLLEGKEINTYFACDNQVISIFSSFISQTPSFEILETIEDTVVYTLSHHSLMELYSLVPKFEKIGRILAEKNYLCMYERTLLMQTKTAKEKYLDFIKHYDKKIIQRVSQYHIASYLGIAPESLSRVRKEISTS